MNARANLPSVEQIIADTERLLDNPNLGDEDAKGLRTWLDNDAAGVRSSNQATQKNMRALLDKLIAKHEPKPKRVRKEQEPPPNLELEPGFDFQVAFAPTVKQASENRTFTLKTLAKLISDFPPVKEDVATALIEKHGDVQGALEIKRLGPAIYFGRYPEGSRVRTGQNIEACTAIVLDFDGRAGDRVHRDQLLATCRKLGIMVLIHDSFSANGDGYTYRAIFPCNELAIDCYASAAMALKQLLGMGPKTILPASQGYFFQARPGRKPNVQALFGRSVDQVLDFDSLEAIADGVAPAGQSQSGSYDLLDAMDHAFDDAGKELFARCLTAVEPWSEDRGHWISIVGAGLRGWGLTPQKLGNLNTLTEQEQGIITRLDAWSKNEHPPTGALKKYSPNCVVIEGRKLFSLAAKKLGLAGMVRKAHESSPEGIGALLEGEPVLNALAERILAGKPANAEQARPAEKPTIKFSTFDEMLATDIRPDWIVKNVIERATLSCFAGPPKVTKSFLAYDLGLCVAAGIPWGGHKTTQGAVFVIAGEGHGGVSRRIRGWHKAHPDHKNLAFYVSDRGVMLDQERNAEAIADEVARMSQQYGVTPILVIIDTLSRNFGGEENSNSEMANFVTKVDAAFKFRFNAAVLIVHHSTKNGEELLRGASALKGALDALFEVKKAASVIDCITTEFITHFLKDGRSPDKMTFECREVLLGVDEDLDDITTLVPTLVPNIVRKGEEKEDVAGDAGRLLSIINRLYMDEPVSRTLVSEEALRAGIIKPNSQSVVRESLSKLINELISKNQIKATGTTRNLFYEPIATPSFEALADAEQ